MNYIWLQYQTVLSGEGQDLVVPAQKNRDEYLGWHVPIERQNSL
jgi:hypothetical protein